MARTLVCRHADCGKPYDSIAGDQPAVCPTCGKAAHWTTDPGAEPVMERRKLPRVPYDLNINDKRLLRQLRIAAE